MTVITQAYPLKLPQKEVLRQRLDLLRKLSLEAGQQLLEKLWTEEWIEGLQDKKKKAYKVIGEQQVVLSKEGQQLYLPSRIRRCITEWVGRILRSQGKRKDCYEDVLRIVQTTGVEGNLDILVKTVALSLIQFEGKYYRWALIRQVLRTFRRYHYRLGLDLTVLKHNPYTKMVTPVIHSFGFPYSPDDGQAMRMDWQRDNIVVKMKLPLTRRPLKRSDWQWHTITLPIPCKILERVNKRGSKLHLPTLRYIQLKGGLILPFLEFAWSFPIDIKGAGKPHRVLATDLGLIHLTTSVICEAGSQISQPIFWSPDKQLLHKIEQLHHHIARLQKKLDRYPEHWAGQGKRRQELDRIHQKLNRYRELILHLTSNHLLETALREQCQTLVLEDLRSYNPPKNKRSLSRKLSNWLRGSLYKVLLYKAKRVGIEINRVNAQWTSRYCPRCGTKGQKIGDPNSKISDQLGRFFSCPSCYYTADRDYIASVNIYRMYLEQQNNSFSLQQARPVSYRGAGIPRNRPRGASIQATLSG